MAQQAKNKLNLRLEIINNSFDKNRDKINAPGSVFRFKRI